MDGDGEMFSIKGKVIGEEADGSLVRKLVKMKVTEKPDVERLLRNGMIVNLVRPKLALLTVYNGKAVVEEYGFMDDDVDSCEADEITSLL